MENKVATLVIEFHADMNEFAECEDLCELYQEVYSLAEFELGATEHSIKSIDINPEFVEQWKQLKSSNKQV